MATNKEPMVKIAGQWVPTHRIWKMLETVNTATDLVERYNQENPEQATPITIDAVSDVRARLRALQMELPQSPQDRQREVANIANELLATLPVDEVVAILEREHETETDIKGLITLVGQEAYMGSMQREAEEYVANMITPDQIAELWNESHRPAPHGGLWTEHLIKKTFEL